MKSNHSIFKFIVELLEDERESLIKEIVSRVLEGIDTQISSSTNKVLITTDELVELLSLSKSTIIKLRKQGMPFVQIGEAIRFDVIEVKNYLTKNFKS